MLFGRGFKVLDNYYLDVCFLYKFRSYKDGITFFNLDIDLDLYKGDHNPKFKASLAILNYYLFDFVFYNINHYNES